MAARIYTSSAAEAHCLGTCAPCSQRCHNPSPAHCRMCNSADCECERHHSCWKSYCGIQLDIFLSDHLAHIGQQPGCRGEWQRRCQLCAHGFPPHDEPDSHSQWTIHAAKRRTSSGAGSDTYAYIQHVIWQHNGDQRLPASDRGAAWRQELSIHRDLDRHQCQCGTERHRGRQSGGQHGFLTLLVHVC